MDSKEPMDLRAGVFIDASNLFWAIGSKDKTGKRINYDIDFAKLRDLLQTRYAPAFHNYYVCQDKLPSNERYNAYNIRAVRQAYLYLFVQKLPLLGVA